MTMEYEAPTRTSPTYGYYRQPDGWITASPATDTDELQYRRSGWEPLKRYGMFEMSTPYSAAHPLEALFMRGGASELTEDQIRRQGLYINPLMVPGCGMPLGDKHKRHSEDCMARAKPVVFPQLSHMTDLGPFPCMICGGNPPSRVLPTEEALDQHTRVMHAPEKSDERTGQSLSAALIKGLGGQNPISAPKDLLERLEALQAQIDALTRTVPAPRSAPWPAPRPAPRPRPYDPKQAKHNHPAPYGRGYLKDGCPRCEELAAPAAV